MEEQNYANHRRYVPAYHFVLFGIFFLTFIGAGVNLYQSIGDHARLYSASLIFVMRIGPLMLFLTARRFPLKAQ